MSIWHLRDDVSQWNKTQQKPHQCLHSSYGEPRTTVKHRETQRGYTDPCGVKKLLSALVLVYENHTNQSHQPYLMIENMFNYCYACRLEFRSNHTWYYLNVFVIKTSTKICPGASATCFENNFYLLQCFC